MRRFTKNKQLKPSAKVHRLSRIETLSPRVVLSGMVMYGPIQAAPLPEREASGSEIAQPVQIAEDLRELDVDSLPKGVRPDEPCPYDPTLHIRQPDQREPEELIPITQAGNNVTENDIPEEMRNTDELFGDRDFWILGSRPLDHVSQEVSGPGTEQYPDFGPPLAFDPSSLLAPGPLGGAPDSNLGNILSQIPSLSDVANDGGGFWEWFKGLFSDDDEEQEPDTPPSENSTSPSDEDWVDVDAPPFSPPVVQVQAEFWNKGMSEATDGSETNSGLSSLTTHLDKRK